MMVHPNRKTPYRPSMSAVFWLACLAVAIDVNAASFVVPYDPVADSFTYVKVESHFFGTGIDNDGEANHGAPTSFSASLEKVDGVGAYAGQVDGSGFATYETLGASVSVVDGSGVHDGYTTAAFNEIYTVAPPAGVAAGTPGSMTFNYFLDGETIVDYNAAVLGDDRINGTVHPWAPDFLAIMRFSLWKRSGPDTGPVLNENRVLMRLDDLPTGAIFPGGPHNAVLSHALISAEVTFNYGEPFALLTKLRVDGFVDQGSGGANTPYVNEVSVDFLNTARLVAIINDAHPEAEVTGVAGSYGHLVRSDVPAVPVPAAGWLFGSALLLFIRRQRMERR